MLICKPKNLSRPSDLFAHKAIARSESELSPIEACLDDVIGCALDPCFVRLGPLARILGKRRLGADSLSVNGRR